MIAKIIPSLLFGSVLGAIVDRFDRRKLMIVVRPRQWRAGLGLLFTNSVRPRLPWRSIYSIVLLMETGT